MVAVFYLHKKEAKGINPGLQSFHKNSIKK
jgi:hypothetical protein